MTKVATLACMPPATDLVEEVLIASLDALTRAEIAAAAEPTRESRLGVTRAMNDLFDICLQAGMPLDQLSITQWAGQQVCRAQVAA